MGLNARSIELLILLKTRGHLPPKFSVIEIGAQQLSRSFFQAPDRLAELQRCFGINEPLPVQPPAEDAAAPLARGFWTWLGAEYAAIDIDGTPGSIPLDLNVDGAPVPARGAFHLVTNFGTTEHIANQLNAFKVIHDLAGPGGVFVHEVPAQGMWNHGLVNYNPKFFWMLARSNGYEVIFMDYVSSPTPEAVPANVVDYVSQFAPDIRIRAPGYGAPDAGLVVVLRKAVDIEFVAPIDVPEMLAADNPDLRKRYWTVLEPDGQTRLTLRQPGSVWPNWLKRRVKAVLFRLWRAKIKESP